MAKMSPKMMKAYAAYEKKEPAGTKKMEAKAGMKMMKKAASMKKMGKKK
jgi:hypothetical protein